MRYSYRLHAGLLLFACTAGALGLACGAGVPELSETATIAALAGCALSSVALLLGVLGFHKALLGGMACQILFVPAIVGIMSSSLPRGFLAIAGWAFFMGEWLVIYLESSKARQR